MSDSPEPQNIPALAPEKAALCKLCSKDLGPFELSVNAQWHKECCICYVCKGEVHRDIVVKYVKEAISYLGHSTCHERYMSEEISKRPIQITQGVLDYLNNMSLMMVPDLSRSEEDNCSLADSAGKKQWLHMSSLDEKYIALRKMQTVCAAWSIALKNDRETANVLIKREEFTMERLKRDAEKMASVTEYRGSEQRKVEIKREKKTPDWKAITGLIATGAFTEETARAFLKEQKSKHTSKDSKEQVN